MRPFQSHFCWGPKKMRTKVSRRLPPQSEGGSQGKMSVTPCEPGVYSKPTTTSTLTFAASSGNSRSANGSLQFASFFLLSNQDPRPRTEDLCQVLGQGWLRHGGFLCRSMADHSRRVPGCLALATLEDFDSWSLVGQTSSSRGWIGSSFSVHFLL